MRGVGDAVHDNLAAGGVHHGGHRLDVHDLTEKVGNVWERDDSSSFGKNRFEIFQSERARFGVDSPPADDGPVSLELEPASDVGLVPLLAHDDFIAGTDRPSDAVCEHVHQAGATRTKNDSADSLAVHESVHESMGPLDGGGRAITRGITGAELDVVVEKVVANRICDAQRNLGTAGVLQQNRLPRERWKMGADRFDVREVRHIFVSGHVATANSVGSSESRRVRFEMAQGSPRN